MMTHEPHSGADALPAQGAGTGRCQTCRYWQHDSLAEHRGHGIRLDVRWQACTRTGYLTARVGHAYTAADFGCILWEAAAP